MSTSQISYNNTNIPSRGDAITLTFFNGFFDQTFSFDANQFGAVYGLFKGLRLDDISTYTLTFTLLAEAINTGMNPLDMVKTLLTKDGLKFNRQTVQLFNRTRKKTSYVGYRVTTELNPYINHMLVE